MKPQKVDLSGIDNLDKESKKIWYGIINTLAKKVNTIFHCGVEGAREQIEHLIAEGEAVVVMDDDGSYWLEIWNSETGQYEFPQNINQ